MKNSQSRWRLGGGWLLRSTAAIGSLLAIAVSRGALADAYLELKENSDGYALMSPEQLIVASLGHRAAVADLIYAHTLVSYGLHFQERRRFEHVGEYLDAVTTLDPEFVEPYLYADTLLTLQPEPPHVEDYRKARELVLKGTRALPFSHEIWDTAGQYLAYLAPPHLDDASEASRWKRQGALLLSKACELNTGDASSAPRCLAAAKVLNRGGERRALIRMLTRTLAVNDDPNVQRRAMLALQRWVGEREREQYEERAQAFSAAWQQDLPYVSKERLLLLGPRFAPAECAGLAASHGSKCAATWARWSQLQD